MIQLVGADIGYGLGKKIFGCGQFAQDAFATAAVEKCRTSARITSIAGSSAAPSPAPAGITLYPPVSIRPHGLHQGSVEAHCSRFWQRDLLTASTTFCLAILA